MKAERGRERERGSGIVLKMTMTKEFVKKTFAVALSRLVSALTSGRV